MITSASNDKIKEIKKLIKSASRRKETGLYIVEGIRMVREIPADAVKTLYVAESMTDKFADICNQIPAEVEIVRDSVFQSMSDTNTPQGILAEVYQTATTEDDLFAGDAAPFLLIIERLQDPGNLGTIIRTAEGAGVTGIILSADTVDIYNPKVIRSTMGSIFRVPFVYVDDLFEVIKMMKDRNITTYAAHLNGTDYTRESYTSGTAFLIGNEGNGLTDELTDNAQKKIKIPMCGRVESLNAAMASGESDTGTYKYLVCRWRSCCSNCSIIWSTISCTNVIIYRCNMLIVCFNKTSCKKIFK